MSAVSGCELALINAAREYHKAQDALDKAIANDDQRSGIVITTLRDDRDMALDDLKRAARIFGMNCPKEST